MRITVDTNVLLRILVADDAAQTRSAVETVDGAEVVAVSLQALCEFAWVLGQRYRMPKEQVADAILNILDTHRVSVDRAAVQAGMSMLIGGSDFADGVIAHEGARLGGDTFVSFDRKAVSVLKQQGRPAQLLV